MRTFLRCLALASTVAIPWSALAAESERVLVGTYTAPDLGEPGPIRAVFSPSGETDGGEIWSVVFTVTFDTAEYIFRGTAEGGLDQGELSGEVENESGSESYMFRGRHREGAFHATHAETTGGFMSQTGRMTLSGEQAPE